MSTEQISRATNAELIRRLAVIAEQAQRNLISRRPDAAALTREQARIWQEFGVRRRCGRLRMTPKTIRGKVFRVQMASYR